MTKERKQQQQQKTKTKTKTKTKKKKTHTHTPGSKQSINLEESSRLKANSEVNNLVGFFLFLSLLFRFLFFSLGKRAQSKPNQTKKRCREDIYI